VTTAVGAGVVVALLREGQARLETVGLPSARQDAEWLLATLLGVDRFALYLEPRRSIPTDARDRYRASIERRALGEPLSYLLGFEDFLGLRVRVTPDVLIPRPETEGLVEWALEILKDAPDALVADIGTGSGAIACALAGRLPRIEVLAVERSLGALAVASENARAFGLSRRVRILAGDLFGPLSGVRRALDLVVANPPYLPSAVIGTLPREVAAFEPRMALDGGPDGMAVLRRIITGAPTVLRAGGWLLLEIGEDQAGSLASLMAAEGFSAIAARRDLRGVERYIAGRLGDDAVPAGRRQEPGPGC